MLKKIVIIFGISFLVLLNFNYCLALEEIKLTNPSRCGATDPEGGCECNPGDTQDPGCGVPVTDVFKWEAMKAEGPIKYVLDIDKYTQSEDNIYPNRLSPECVFDETEVKECVFPFPNLTCCDISRNEESFLETYCWHVTAYDTDGNLAGYSIERCFFTEDEPPDFESLPEDVPPEKTINPIILGTLEEVFNFLLTSIFFITLTASAITIIWAAFLFVTSGGDPQKITSARKIIVWAVVALVVAILSKAAQGIIKGMLGGGS